MKNWESISITCGWYLFTKIVTYYVNFFENPQTVRSYNRRDDFVNG